MSRNKEALWDVDLTDHEDTTVNINGVWAYNAKQAEERARCLMHEPALWSVTSVQKSKVKE